MSEKEFDIQVRNLLTDAQEPVSPKVWEGVSAALDRKGRIVPLWRWAALAGVAAAAAVAAIVVFREPVPIQDHSNPIISIAEASTEVVPLQESLPQEVLASEPAGAPVSARLAQASAVVPAAVSARPTVPAAAAQEVSVQAATEAAPALPEAPSAADATSALPEAVSALSANRSVQPSSPAAALSSASETPAPEAASASDQALLNSLAYAEESAGSGRGFSFHVSGNIQNKRRNAVPVDGYQRYGVPPAPGSEEGIYNESPEVGFGLPFSAGVGFKYNFTPRWAVGAGLRYTNLSRTFVGDYVKPGYQYQQRDIDNIQHWLGVPVHAYYDIVNNGRWRVHAFAGGAVEFLISNDYLVHGPQSDIHFYQNSRVPQFSADAGLGIEFRITPLVGIYVDPSFRYYFATARQPRSLRTVQPQRFDIEAGVRFSFGQ